MISTVARPERVELVGDHGLSAGVSGGGAAGGWLAAGGHQSVPSGPCYWRAQELHPRDLMGANSLDGSSPWMGRLQARGGRSRRGI